MKNSFEWKKDIEDKVKAKRAAMAKRNAQLRSITGVSLAAVFCLGCGIAVVRFSNVNQPPVAGTSDSIMTIPSHPDEPIPPVTTGANTTDTDNTGVMTIPSFTDGPAYTQAGGTGICVPPTEELTGSLTGYDPRDTEDHISQPIYTGVDPYPMTTGPLVTEYPTTTEVPNVGSFRVIKEIGNIVNGSPMYVPADRMVKHRKTFSEALRYYGLSEFAIPNVLTFGNAYAMDQFEYVEFISMKDENGMGELPVSDAITVRYSPMTSDISFYELSMGMIRAPYDCMYVYDENSTFNYRDIAVKCGYLKASGAVAELIVADFEYNGVIFRFQGHYSTEKTFISFLYSIIDGLYTR